MKVNVKDFPEIEAKLASITDFEDEANKDYLNTHTGPSVGIEWDDETKKLVIVPGWAEDQDGYVVNIAASTGPGSPRHGRLNDDGIVVYN